MCECSVNYFTAVLIKHLEILCMLMISEYLLLRMVDVEKYKNSMYAARKRIQNVTVQTPLLYSKWLSKETGANIYLKMECEQITNSFKLRGAVNTIYKLHEETMEAEGNIKKIVTASSGNHGVACAYAASKLNVPLSVYVYTSIPKVKEERLLEYSNVEIVKHGEECCEAEVYGRTCATRSGLLFISPYNNTDVICGQATIGLELLDQLKSLDAVIVPVGGGGLISGIALAIKLHNPNIKVIGCQPKNDCCMFESINAGKILDDNIMASTFSDGTAGRVEPGSVTFEICKNYVDEWVLVEEEDIQRAVFDMMDKQKKIIEGAAGLAVAAARKNQADFKNKNVAVIMCGANIGIESIKYLVNKYSK